MKIKDILTEGPLDYIKGLAKTGSLAGASAASQQAKAIKNIKPFVTSIINSWNRTAGLTGNNTADAAVAWAKKTFKSNLENVTPPENDSAQAINRFLTDASKLYRAGELTPVKQPTTTTTAAQPTTTAPAAQPTTTGAPSQKAKPALSAAGRRGTMAATPTGTPNTQPAATKPGEIGYVSPTTGITVTQNTDPWILTYQKKNYMLNDNGYWAVDGKNTKTATAPASLQPEFDKAAGPGFETI